MRSSNKTKTASASQSDARARNFQDGNTVEPSVSGENIGAALKSVYQNALDESIPDEFMDLLNRLD